MKIVIVGASFAGMSAALECRSVYPEARISLIDKEETVGYLPTALNGRLKGEIVDWSEAISPLYQELIKEEIDWWLGWEVCDYDFSEQVIFLERKNERQSFDYDVLILAMGASQSWDKQSGDLSTVLVSSKSLSQMQSSYQRLEQTYSIALVGAGQIGLESAEALNHLEIRLCLLEAQGWPLAKYFDREMVQWLVEELASREIEAHFSQTVNDIHLLEDGQVELTTLAETYRVNQVVLATNFRPNTESLADQIALHGDGTVVVDAYLRTSVAKVFAIGDLIRLPFSNLGSSYLPLMRHACLTGRLVAHNLLSERRKLERIERTISSRLFGRYLMSVGVTEHEAQLRLDTTVVRIHQDLAEQGTLDFKLVASSENGRILGGQLISSRDESQQMNLLELALSQDLSVENLWQQVGLYMTDQFFLYQALQQYLLQEKRE